MELTPYVQLNLDYKIWMRVACDYTILILLKNIYDQSGGLT